MWSNLYEKAIYWLGGQVGKIIVLQNKKQFEACGKVIAHFKMEKIPDSHPAMVLTGRQGWKGQSGPIIYYFVHRPGGDGVSLMHYAPCGCHIEKHFFWKEATEENLTMAIKKGLDDLLASHPQASSPHTSTGDPAAGFRTH